MYTNRRRVRPPVFDDSVMRDEMTETCDLLVSVPRVSASQMSLSHVVPLYPDLFTALCPELFSPPYSCSVVRITRLQASIAPRRYPLLILIFCKICAAPWLCWPPYDAGPKSGAWSFSLNLQWATTWHWCPAPTVKDTIVHHLFALDCVCAGSRRRC
jgi:hypothetical protein